MGELRIPYQVVQDFGIYKRGDVVYFTGMRRDELLANGKIIATPETTEMEIERLRLKELSKADKKRLQAEGWKKFKATAAVAPKAETAAAATPEAPEKREPGRRPKSDKE